MSDMKGGYADLGQVFPPRDEWDVAAYDGHEVAEGYQGHRIDDTAPGPNHSPSYRWGWTNARKDATYRDGEDGFEEIRRAYIQLERKMA